jgi:hypothetical protein
VVDAVISREIVLAVPLALAQEIEITTVRADAAEDLDQDQDPAAPEATPLAMAGDTTREAIPQREKRERGEVAAAGLQRVVSALEATLAATVGETLAHLLVPRAPAMKEDLNLQEKLRVMELLQINTKAHLKLLPPTAKLTLKNKPTEASVIFTLIKGSWTQPPEPTCHI